MHENEISGIVLDCAIEVHRHLGGPGLLESVYEEALVWELRQRGLSVKRQVLLPVTYKGIPMGGVLRFDILIEDKVVIECKATNLYNPIFEVQLMTYLRQANKRLGIVINFGCKLVSEQYIRVPNNLTND